MKWLILIASLLSLNSAIAAQWQAVPGGPASGWGKLTCESGSGWRPCKAAPACRYDSSLNNWKGNPVPSAQWGWANVGACRGCQYGTYFFVDGTTTRIMRDDVREATINGKQYRRGAYIRTNNYKGMADADSVDLYELCEIP